MSRRVRILHPGYKSSNTLFVLPTVDRDERTHLHYPTAWTACSIIINNRTDHWLSTSPTGEPRVSADVDSLLVAGDYYLHLPDSEADTAEPYPIVPNFRVWQFPHDHLPDLWRAASQNDERLAARENFTLGSVAIEKCRITNRELGTQHAHIIPKEEKPWFTSNGMQEYGPLSTRSGETMADLLSNKVGLRSDGHMLWDRCDFSIVPRAANGITAWHTQVMNEGEELHEYWHRQQLLPLPGRPAQYLYARFAYNLFTKLHIFLHSGRARFLIACRADGTVEQRQFSAQECWQFTEKQGRNRSPTKRSRSRANGEDDGIETRESRHGSPVDSFLQLKKHHTSVDSAISGFHTKRRRSGSRTFGAESTESDDSDDFKRGRKRYRESLTGA